MLTILHGDNIVASRSELSRLKQQARDKETRDMNGKDISESELRQAVESLSLFGNTVIVVFENLLSGLGRKEKLINLYAKILEDAGNTIDIIIWEPKELGKIALGAFKKATTKLFKTPATIFEFLDSLKPQHAQEILAAYEKTSESQPPELILYMMQMRIRGLIQAKEGVSSSRSQGWQFMRLTNQSRSFTMNRLLIMHQQLIDLEYSLKTGSSPFTLSQLLKQVILEL